MLASDRRLRILERVADEHSIHVGELAGTLGVSEMTIRRDIQALERDGYLRRTYGGATAHLTRAFDLAFNARSLQKTREKRLIALTAAGLVGDAHALFIGIGTTAEQFARYLPTRPDLTVVTASLPIASLLGTRAVSVVGLGGTVRRDELSFVGAAALSTLERYRFDAAVIGAAGVSVIDGVSDLDADDAAVNRRAAELSTRVIVIADGSKLGATAMAVVAPIDRIDTLVTDGQAPADQVGRLRDRGVRVVIAAGPTSRED